MTLRMKAKDFRGGLFAGGQKGPQALEPKETSISKAIADYLDAHRIYNDRINSGRVEVVKSYIDKKTGATKEFRNWVMLAKKGTPDRFFIMSGRIYFTEVKQRGKRPTPEQTERHHELRCAGAKIIVADSIDSFIAQFEELFALREKHF